MNLSREEKLQQLERIVQSQAFHEAESLRAFLSFIVNKLVNGEEDHIKEYTIATDVFGRGSQFNPRIDSVVRVQAGRLRYKLHEYYSTEGKADKILIELPKGHYKPVFSYQGSGNGTPKVEVKVENPLKEVAAVSAPLLLAAATPPTPQPLRREKIAILGLSAAVVMLVILTAFLLIATRQPIQANPSAAASKRDAVYEDVWGIFFNSSEPPLVVVGNPTVYRLANPMDPMTQDARTIRLSLEQTRELGQAIGKEKFLMNSIKNNSAPRLLLCTDEYTGMGEAIGLHYVTSVMRSAGKSLVLKQSRTASAEDLKNHDAILLGSIWVNEWTGKQPVKESFIYSDNATILNLEPQGDEAPEYKPKFHPVSGKLVEDYALITVKPSLSGKSTMMILAGIYSEGTQAAAEFATSKDYLPSLNQHLRQIFGDQPTLKYYQALLKVTVDNGIPTLISLVSVHRLQVAD
ncbi:MAG: hypothetical protein HY231_17440 [Acidobacteria bacterium]|nr:hypothetical protein [Acidobacteriota bacterium]